MLLLVLLACTLPADPGPTPLDQIPPTAEAMVEATLVERLQGTWTLDRPEPDALSDDLAAALALNAALAPGSPRTRAHQQAQYQAQDISLTIHGDRAVLQLGPLPLRASLVVTPAANARATVRLHPEGQPHSTLWEVVLRSRRGSTRMTWVSEVPGEPPLHFSRSSSASSM